MLSLFIIRRSHLLCCLAIAPNNLNTPNSPSPVLPIYHGTYLNLTRPILSAVATCILGKDHHSSDEVDHIEVCCFQDHDLKQAAIQQYHVRWESVFGDISKRVHVIESGTSPSKLSALNYLGQAVNGYEHTNSGTMPSYFSAPYSTPHTTLSRTTSGAEYSQAGSWGGHAHDTTLPVPPSNTVLPLPTESPTSQIHGTSLWGVNGGDHGGSLHTLLNPTPTATSTSHHGTTSVPLSISTPPPLVPVVSTSSGSGLDGSNGGSRLLGLLKASSKGMGIASGGAQGTNHVPHGSK